MKIGVCVKSTPDTDTRIKIAGSGNGIDETGVKWIISPYDAFAIEEGVKTKEKLGGEAILYSVGGDIAGKNLRDGLAVGADSAVQIDDPALAGSDALGVARALAAAIKADGVEIVFCGKQAIDDDNAQVPSMVAELLGWPQITQVSAFEINGNEYKATRVVGGGVEEIVTGSVPVLVSATRGLNTPRYAKLPDIMKAKKKPLAVKNLAALGLSAGDVAPKITLTGYSLPPQRASGRILKADSREELARQLVSLLRNEAKVI